MNEIMYSVGYVDIQAYRDVFKKVAGMTPSNAGTNTIRMPYKFFVMNSIISV